MAPAYCPPGRWPAAPAKALVLSQQFAVNAIIAQLASRSGLFAVNGPPGTGKTTLLRDLIAAILVARAAEMVKLKRPSQAFVRRACISAKNDTTQWVLGPRDELTGFEIVVASSNNAAVENVTRELPARRTLGEPWQEKADYFADQASMLGPSRGPARQLEEPKAVLRLVLACQDRAARASGVPAKERRRPSRMGRRQEALRTSAPESGSTCSEPCRF